MNTTTIDPQIVAFAAAVREALSDLPADDVDDLTDGLEADLAESLAEDLRRTLPDPGVYAQELRIAAGLPSRQDRGASGVARQLGDVVRHARQRTADLISDNSVLRAAVQFLGTLRPVWWLTRAWMATWLLSAVFGMESGFWFDGLWWVGFLAFCVVSVQWGRGAWRFTGMPVLIVAGNIFAVVALPFVLNAAEEMSGETEYIYVNDLESHDLTGVYLNGDPVTNIFAYDAKGRPLRDIQLFDEHGNPLATSVPGGNGCIDPECEMNGLWASVALNNGTIAWNVYPMRMTEAQYSERTGALVAVPGATPTERDLPFKRVPSVVQSEKKK